MGRGWIPPALLLAAALGPPSARAAEAVPRDGLDAVVLADGRAILCHANRLGDGRVELGFEGGAVALPAASVAEIRRFQDFDPVPRTDDERKSASAGLVHWAGRWVDPPAREQALAADRAREKKGRAEAGGAVDWADRAKRSSAHFSIESDLAKKDVDLYEGLLEAFYGYFTSGLKVSVRNRIPVYILRTREEFQEFQLHDTGHVSEHTVGYFMPAPGREHLVLFDWQGDRAETLAVMFHETTHLFIHLANPEIELPTMINEGIAEYYGAATFRKGKFTRGLLQDDRLNDLLQMIEEGHCPSIETLLAHGHPDRDAPGWKEFSLDDYAQSWAFVHFLFHAGQGKYLPGLLSYLNNHWTLKWKEADPKSSKDYRSMKYADDRALLLRMLKVKDFAALDREFLDYVKGLKPSEASGRVSRAFHLLRTKKDREGAGTELRAALAAAGDDVDVLGKIVRGFSMVPGCEKEAAVVLDRVLALDPLNMALRYELTSWFPDGDTEVPHLRVCAGFDPEDTVGINARAWLAYRGIRVAGLPAGGAGTAEDLAAERAALLAKAKPSAADLLRAADLSLRLGGPEPAREAGTRAAEADPASPAPQALLAKAAAALGDGKGFTASLAAFRRAAEKRAAAEGRAAGAAERETLGAFVDAVAFALDGKKLPEARRAVDAWFAQPGFTARTEGEWILYAGLALKTGDIPVGFKRLARGLAAVPGASRLMSLPAFLPDQNGGGDDGGK